ncbi:hypothetical protein CKK34_6171 [Yarrowia sp. E02]|nr:hypothetical protein CKK34_6171 [Yarrowia sp. E02]
MLLSLPSLPKFIRTLHSELVAKRQEVKNDDVFTDSARDPITPPIQRTAEFQLNSPSLKRDSSDPLEFDATPTKKRRGDLKTNDKCPGTPKKGRQTRTSV